MSHFKFWRVVSNYTLTSPKLSKKFKFSKKIKIFKITQKGEFISLLGNNLRSRGALRIKSRDKDERI